MIKRSTLLAAVIACTTLCLRAQEKKDNPVQSKAEQNVQKASSAKEAQNLPTSQAFKDQYLEQVKKSADLEATAHAEILRKRYSGDASMVKLFKKAFYDRRIAVETLLLGQSSPEQAKQLRNVISSSDSLVERYTLAAKNKNLVNNKVLDENDNSKFASAIRNRAQLKLTTPQADTLLRYANRLKELNKSGSNAKEYERKILPTVLSDEQYTQLLVSLNHKTAYSWAIGSWQGLKERGMHEDLDSAKTVNAIINYNIAKLVKMERYANHIPKASASIKSLETPEPEGLKRIRVAKAYNNPIPAKAVAEKTKFTW